MVLATANTQETERYDLKTLKGGYVALRRLTYGEKLQRRQMTSGMKVQGGGRGKDFEGEMQLVSEKATVFDFQRCIVEHNLEKPAPPMQVLEGDVLPETVPLDFSKLQDIQQLDPRVGEEIDTLISNMNNFEEDDEQTGN